MTFPHPRQSGGTFLGLIIGLVLGLGIALAVAVYVTKAPVPFIDRGLLSANENEAEQARKNQNWDPNAGFNQNRATPPAPAAPETENVASPTAAAPDQAAPAATADPLGELIQQRASGEPDSGAAPTAPAPTLPPPASLGQVQELVFFVQAGAYGQVGDAENQRAKLALMGVDTRVSQDVVNERTIYRVRSGPYRTRSQALKIRQILTDQNVESVVVAVPK